MSTRITRGHTPKPQVRMALTILLATTPEINVEEFATGGVSIPATSTISRLTFYAAAWATSSQSVANTVADIPAPVFGQLRNAANAAVILNVTPGCAYALPADCFAFGAIKILPDNAGAVDIGLKG